MITLSFTFYMSSFILISNSLPYFSYLCSPTPVTWSILSLSTGFRIHMWISVLSENTIYGGIFSRRAISVRSSRSFWKSGWSYFGESADRGFAFPGWLFFWFLFPVLLEVSSVSYCPAPKVRRIQRAKLHDRIAIV